MKRRLKVKDLSAFNLAYLYLKDLFKDYVRGFGNRNLLQVVRVFHNIVSICPNVCTF